jgi:2'-5' RNA ligase
VIDLGAGTAFRVESEELEDIRHDLAEAFRGLMIPQDLAPWRPHITIQNKVEPREARRLSSGSARPSSRGR